MRDGQEIWVTGAILAHDSAELAGESVGASSTNGSEGAGVGFLMRTTDIT